MLVITFWNDSTGDHPLKGNYEYWVRVNQKIVAEGRIEGYSRLGGWQGLVKSLADQVGEGVEREESDEV